LKPPEINAFRGGESGFFIINAFGRGGGRGGTGFSMNATVFVNYVF
jgi:hypothetical protein